MQYRDALNKTSLAFRDPALSGGQPVLDLLGMPRPISGNFASVFTIRGTDGRRWAVKCFTRYVADQETRYQRVSETLQQVNSSWKVGFTYLPDGVLCQGTRYPVLKMEWVEAMGLLPYIEEHLRDQGRLADLAGKFGDLVQDLSRNGIAHGDLQHGNILVTPSGQLKLIDYDGMFVPGLDGQGASELGHDNYQSPLRTRSNWGPDIDRFSSWVIYASLIALALDPMLWQELHADGDEALLFHKSDFTDHDGSRARYALANSAQPMLRAIASDIDFLWAQDLAAIPPLEAILRPNAPSRAPRRTDSVSATGADWLQQNHLFRGAPQGAADVLGATAAADHVGPAGGVSWLTTHLPIAPQIDFRQPQVAIRIIFVILLSFMTLIAVLASAVTPTVLSLEVFPFAIAWVATFVPYKLTGEAGEKRRSYRALRDRQRAAARANQEVSGLEKAAHKLDRESESAKATIEKKGEKARADEQHEIAAVDKRLGNGIKKSDHEITKVQNKSRSEVSAALRGIQQSHMDTYMRQAWISSAKITGIGPALVSSLAGSGIRTAADFTGIRYIQKSRGTRGVVIVLRNGFSVSPHGIGEKKAQALDSWRRSIEFKARATQPMSLPPAQVSAISAKYAQQIRSLESDKETARARASMEKDDLRKKWAKTHAAIAKELTDEAARFARLRIEKNPGIASARQRVETANWQRDFAKRELNRYRRIRYVRYLKKLLTG